MNLWQAYSNATTETENRKLENELIQKYTPMIKRVWKLNFSNKPFDECYTEALPTVWEAIQSWKKQGKIGQQTERQWRNFVGRAIWNNLSNYWRNRYNSKQSIAASNVEGLEAIVGTEESPLSIEARREEAEKQLREIFEGREEYYEQFLEVYGNRDGNIIDSWEEYNYSSRDSMKAAMHKMITKFRSQQTA